MNYRKSFIMLYVKMYIYLKKRASACHLFLLLPCDCNLVFLMSQTSQSEKFKPIFNCDAIPFALGTGVGLDPQRHTFASPNAKYTNMLVYFGVT